MQTFKVIIFDHLVETLLLPLKSLFIHWSGYKNKNKKGLVCTCCMDAYVHYTACVITLFPKMQLHQLWYSWAIWRLGVVSPWKLKDFSSRCKTMLRWIFSIMSACPSEHAFSARLPHLMRTPPRPVRKKREMVRLPLNNSQRFLQQSEQKRPSQKKKMFKQRSSMLQRPPARM